MFYIFAIFFMILPTFELKCEDNEPYNNSALQEDTIIPAKYELNQKSPSLHIQIATIGRGTLMRMLESLKPQLEPQDFLTVIFDARDDDGVYSQATEFLKDFKCNCNIWIEPENRGYWGHVIHNMYNQLEGDFILHADDDDTYASDAMDTIRRYCIDSDTLYIFQMQYANGWTLWEHQSIYLGGIGKPMGIVPNKYNSQCLWGYSYAGDFDFYNALERIIPKVEFVPHIIYRVRH